MTFSNMFPIRILMVEDNPADVRLTLEAFKNDKIKNILEVVEDGEEAMAFLRKEGKYDQCQTPDLILLDLNLPLKSGLEVLREIKEDEKLSIIPVVILTSSEQEEDIIKSYTHHANCYVTKPVGLNQFTKVIQSIEDFWVNIVKLPHHS